jgi:hypothetical protein
MKDGYETLSRFWNDVIERRQGRRWIAATLYDGDFWLRDGYAWSVVRARLSGRDDVELRYVRAWDTEEQLRFEGCDVLLVGRPRAFHSSCLSRHAHRLSSLAKGRFLDTPTGSPGHTVSYENGKHVFARHDLETSPEHHRRCDVDYAVLQITTTAVEGEERRLVAIAGTSGFGTLGLAMLLDDPRHRERLVEQARALLPWDASLRLIRHCEICVRIEVPQEKLRTCLNEPALDFEVEVVAVASDSDDMELRARGSEVELVLRPHQGPAGGGFGCMKGAEIRLTAKRFDLLRHIVTHPGGASTDELCRLLEPRGNERYVVEPSARSRLAKLVHDVNKSFRHVPGFQQPYLIRSRRQGGGGGGGESVYVLTARGVVRT